MKLVETPKHTERFDSLSERAELSAAAKESLDELITPGKPYLNPLLGQLSQAIKPSGFGEGGTVPEAHEKSVLNLEAMTLLDDVRQSAADRLALITGEASPTGTLAEQLVRLLDLAKRDEDERLRTLRTVASLFAGWVRRIDGVFNPAPACAIQGACVCGATHSKVREDGLDPAVIEERLAKGEAIPETRMLRRSALELRGDILGCFECGMLVEGVEALREFQAKRYGTVIALDAERERHAAMDAAAEAAQALHAA